MKKRQSGLTLIELLLVVAIAAILLGMAVPSLSTFVASSRVSGAADQLKTQIEWARTEAVKDNETVSVFVTAGSNWCIGFEDADSDGNCNCSSTNCQVNGQTKRILYSDFSELTLADNVTDGDSNFTIDNRGISDGNGNITLTDGDYTVQLNISMLGRVSICSNNITKYPTC